MQFEPNDIMTAPKTKTTRKTAPKPPSPASQTLAQRRQAKGQSLQDTPRKSPPPANKAQLDARAYRLAALDQDFLLSEAMRGLRFHMEYEKAEQSLKNWGVRSTIVVFGSARVSMKGPAQHRRWYAQARRFAQIASERGGAMHALDGILDNVIVTGGGPGVMEAANRGAADVGAPSIGLNISLPHEQGPNPYSTPELTFQFHYFAMRKMHFAMRANALVVFPGGFGTMDELFELLTLRQNDKMERDLPIVLFDEEYWRKLFDLDVMAEAGLISPDDLKLFTYADDAEAIWKALCDKGLKYVPAPAHRNSAGGARKAGRKRSG